MSDAADNTNNSDDDMPGLEDDDDADMPTLDEVIASETDQNKNNDTIDKKMIDYFHNVATEEAGLTNLEKKRLENDENLKKRLESSKDEKRVIVQLDPNDPNNYTTSINNSKAVWDPILFGCAYDFRLNKLPPGSSVYNQAHFNRESDGSTSIVLEPGAYLALEPNFWNPKVSKYIIAMEVYFENLPETTISISTVDILRGGGAEIVMSRDGSISMPGGDPSTGKLKTGSWQHLTLSFDVNSKYRHDIALAAVLNNRIILSSRDKAGLLNEKGTLRDKLYLFGSHKSSNMDRTVRIRNVVIQPRCITTYDPSIPDAGGSGYSQFQFEIAKDKFSMYQSLSLSILYNKPPPVWQHPLITATLIRSEHIDRLASGTIHHSALLLWSHLIAQTAQNQKDIFPLIIQDEMEEFLPKGNGNNDDNDDNDDNDKKNQLSSYVFTNESFVQGSLSKISSMWIDACAITKNHPSLTQQPHCGPFVKRITQRIDSLQRGEFTIVPFTFRHLVPPRNQEEKPAIEDVQIFIVIELIDDVFCNVTICNSFLDGGVKYHSLSAAGSEGSILYKPCITATGVKLSLLNSQAAWFGLYETVFSAKKNFFFGGFLF